MFSSVIANEFSSHTRSVQANPQTSHRQTCVAYISTPLCRPLCLCSDAHLTSW